MQTTEWRVATCPCVVLYRWDPNDHESVRAHTGVGGVACETHKALDHDTRFQTCLSESRLWSLVSTTLGDLVTSLAFDDARKLVVHVSAAPAAEHLVELPMDRVELVVDATEP